MNAIFATGNTGKEPEIRTFEDGGKEARFSIAQRMGKDQETQWIDCRVKGKLVDAVVIPYIKKGTKLAVVGDLRIDSWEKDGQKRTSTYILVRDIELMGAKNPNDDSENTHKEEKSDLPASDFSDLPF